MLSPDDEQGRPAFQILQNSRTGDAPIQFYAFDVLNIDGAPLIGLPLDERREALEHLLSDAPPPIRLSPFLKRSPAKILAAVKQLGLEGVVAKRADSAYEPGERSGAWIKQRTNREQEFVIGGYIPGNAGFDSLLVGVYEKRALRFVAKVAERVCPADSGADYPEVKAFAERCIAHSRTCRNRKDPGGANR